jgi:hypothetical protein
MREFTYRDYPFDETPAWQMKIDHEFSREFGNVAVKRGVGHLTDAEFVESVLNMREKYCEAWVELFHSGKQTIGWWN